MKKNPPPFFVPFCEERRQDTGVNIHIYENYHIEMKWCVWYSKHKISDSF